MMKDLFRASLLSISMLLSAELAAQDNVAPRVNDKVRVTGGEKTDFIVTRALMVTAIDSVPYDIARSGTYSVGIGYGFSIAKGLELKVEPRATWHKMYYRPEPDRWFPSGAPDSSVVYEKHRAFYAELPIGLKFKLARNKISDKYQLLMEAGFSTGYNLGSTIKVRSMVNVDQDAELEGKATYKVNKIWELNRLRWGPYARIGTRYVSLYAFYRMTGMYINGRSFSDSPTTSRPYPNFPKLEIGLSVTI